MGADRRLECWADPVRALLRSRTLAAHAGASAAGSGLFAALTFRPSVLPRRRAGVRVGLLDSSCLSPLACSLGLSESVWPRSSELLSPSQACQPYCTLSGKLRLLLSLSRSGPGRAGTAASHLDCKI